MKVSTKRSWSSENIEHWLCDSLTFQVVLIFFGLLESSSSNYSLNLFLSWCSQHCSSLHVILICSYYKSLKTARKRLDIIDERPLSSFINLNLFLAPPYLSELLHHYAPVRCLRSADQLLLEVPRSKRKLRGERAFSTAGPKLWNYLPLHIRQALSLSIFKTHPKTHFYSLAFNPAWDSALVLVFYCFNIVIVLLFLLSFMFVFLCFTFYFLFMYITLSQLWLFK